MRVRFLCDKDPPKTGIVINIINAIAGLIVTVMIRDITIMIGALASRRIVNIYAICTFVMSVVSLVTRPGVEK